MVEPVSGAAPFASLTAARIARGTGPRPRPPPRRPPSSSLARDAAADATAAGKSPSAMPASTSSAPP